MVKVFDSFDDIKEAAVEKAGLTEAVAGGVSIPIIGSPFLDQDSYEKWAMALAGAPPADAGGKGAKGGKAPAKGKGAPTEITEEQTGAFYKDMFDQIKTSLLDGIVEGMFAVIDQKMHSTASTAMSKVPTFRFYVSHPASPRQVRMPHRAR